ncbi:MAG: hypothetical protein JNN30_08535 [Rhodanobacteraceae bacterium]|nr:hypothetical protein [Rhodanobacteraceae bacterium]
MADCTPQAGRSRLFPEVASAPLRVVVVLSGQDTGPRWLAESLHALCDCEFLQLTWCSTDLAPAPDSHGTGAFDRYLRWDQAIAGPLRQILQPAPLLPTGAALQRVDGITLAAGRTAATDTLLKLLDDLQPDLLLLVGLPPPDGRFARAARFGAWTLESDAMSSLRCGSWMLEDFRAGHSSATTGLRVHDSQADAWILLEPGEISVAQISFTRHRAYQLQKVPAQLTRALRRLANGQIRRQTPAQSGFRPGALGTLLLGLRVLARGVRRHLGRPFLREHWHIAVRRAAQPLDPARPTPGSLRRLRPPRGWFWADPAPWRHEGRDFVLVEAYDYATGRGEIQALELDGQLDVAATHTVLRQPHHLSYPHLLHWQGRTFLVVESALAGRVDLWNCEHFPNRWTHSVTLLHGWRMVDPTLFERDGRWWMFACVAETPFDDEGREWNELFLFHAPSPAGPWQPHAQNPVCTDVRRARPAGPVFEHTGRLIRPGQDCAAEYGRAIVFHEIVTLTPDQYQERPLGVLEPDWAPGLRGCHTYARHADLDVLDGKYLASRWST